MYLKLSTRELILNLGFNLIIVSCFLRASKASSIERAVWKPDFEVFQVETVVNRRAHGKRTFRLVERYSASQKRGVIDYEGDYDLSEEMRLRKEDPQRLGGTFFADSKYDLWLQFRKGGYQCATVRSSNLDELIHLVNVDSDLAIPGYIMGPAKWLFYVNNNRANMKLLDLSQDSHRIVRGIPVIEYHLAISPSDGSEEIELTVFYADADLARNRSEALPLVISFARQGLVIGSLEFFSPVSRLDLNQQLADDQRLDPFALDMYTNCWNELEFSKLPTAKLPGDTITNDRARFSFRAGVDFFSIPHSARSSAVFVAYDSSMGMMRIDREWAAPGGVSSTVIVDLPLNTAYHMLVGKKGETNKCIASLIEAPGSSVMPETMGLLLGVKRPKYIGRAQIRWMPALAYVELGSSLPFWLEQPVHLRNPNNDSYKQWDPANELARMSARSGSDEHSIQFFTTFYVLESDPSHLLLIEISRASNGLKSIHDQRIISLSDFKWDLPEQAPNGDTAMELFSLVNRCTRGLSALGESRSRMELLLESEHFDDKFEKGLSKLTHTERDLAFLASLKNELGLTASLIGDFEAKMLPVKDVKEFNGQPRLKVMIQLTLAKQASRYVRINEIGYGKPITSKYLRYPYLSSMFQCFMMAANRGGEVFAAYSESKMVCQVGYRSAGIYSSVESLPYKLQSDGDHLIFRTERLNDSSLGWDEFISSGQYIKLLMKFKRELNVNFGDLPVTFKMLRYIVGDSGVSTEYHGTSSKASSGLEGFGLVEQTGISRQIQSASSLLLCRVACYSDFECNSYSLCVSGQDVDCVISKANLEENFANIKDASEKTKKRSFAVDIKDYSTGETRSINILKKRTCTIYNKLYLDYLITQPSSWISCNQNYALPATSKEQCAAFSLRYNLRRNRELIKTLNDAFETIDRAINEENYDSSSKASEIANEILRPSQTRFGHIGGFYHIEQESLAGADSEDKSAAQKVYQFALSSLEEAIRQEPVIGELFNGSIFSENDLDKYGYCLFKWQHPMGSTENNLKDVSCPPVVARKAIQASWNEINPLYLYEEKRGVRLKQARLTQDQWTAVQRLASGRILDTTDARTAYELARNNENFQILSRSDRLTCARLCFDQQAGIWPACKSFDYVYQVNTRNGEAHDMCYLNSVTLSEAIANNREDIIDRTPYNAGSEYWHYEPLSGLYLEEIDMLRADASVYENFLNWKPSNYRLHSFGLFFTVVLGIVSGVFLGLYAGAIYQNSKKERSNSAVFLDLPDSIAPI